MRNTTKIITDLVVDEALRQSAAFVFDADDRQYIDNQIRGCQQHLVDGMLSGRNATYATLDGASLAGEAGDVVCRTAAGRGTVTRALSSPMASAGVPFGVLARATPPGGRALIITGGIIPPTISRLGGEEGYVRVNTSTARLERRALIADGDYAVGTVGEDGYMQFIPGFASGGGGGGTLTSDEAAWEPDSSPNAKSKARQRGAHTSSASPATVFTIPIVDETSNDVKATVVGRGDASEYFRLDLRGGWIRTDGVVTEADAPHSDPDSEPSAGNPAGWAAALELSGTNILVKVTGENAKDVEWNVRVDVQTVELDAEGGSVPVVVSVTHAVVDPAGGGNRRVVQVDDSTGCTGITAGGVAFTSFLIDDATHVSGVPGAHAAGTVDLVVTNGTGPSTTGGGLIEYWSPASLGFELLHLPGTYSSGSWPGAASAGGSGARTSTEGTNPPAVTSGNPNFDGVNDQLLYTGATIATLASASAFTLVSIFNADVAAADTLVYNNPALVADSAGYLGLTFSDAGLSLYLDGAGAKRKDAACATGGWHLGIGRLSGGNMDLALDNVWGTTLAAGNISATAGTVKLGTNYAGAARFDGKQRLVGIMPTAISNANATRLFKWASGSGHLA